MKIGIVGLPYSGKTSFFNALTFCSEESASARKTKGELAIIKVPDARLDFLTNIFNPRKKVNATLEIDDFMGSSNPEISTYNTQFSNVAKLFDAFILVIRGFEDDSVPHTKGSVDILRDLKEFLEDIELFDLSFIETRLERLEKDFQRQKNKEELLRTKEIIMKWNKALQSGVQLREIETTHEEELLQRNYQMLTMKPLIVAINLSEKDINIADEIVNDIRAKYRGKRIRIEPFFAKIEMELAQLDEEEKQIYMEDFGLKESALTRLLRSAYDLLGLCSFFTVGEDECRAWTIKKGMTAQEAAGVIHTDFFHKFIRAEVVSFKDFEELGSFAKCKEKGVFRLEGKDYIVQDGDIMHIRHS
jgi:GTP-binding protein YchF